MINTNMESERAVERMDRKNQRISRTLLTYTNFAEFSANSTCILRDTKRITLEFYTYCLCWR